jgi:RNA polymerase sigma-70 factor (ECF subfamily)
MVQETFLRAWKRRETYTEDHSLLAWLYKIATNICLDTLKKHRRRVIPITLGDVSSATQPIPAAVLEPIWIDPYPDELLAWGDDQPEQKMITQENIGIAFLAVLQLLPPRQRAALILSDVLDWSASEIADLMEMTISAVKSALHRARSTIAAYPIKQAAPQNSVSQAQLDAYMQAWAAADVDMLVRLLSDEATFSMPPIPSWYRGRDSIGALISKTIFSGEAQGRWRLLPTRANRQIAFGLYRLSESGVYQVYGIQVLRFEDGLIADIITFRHPALATHFKLPASL